MGLLALLGAEGAGIVVVGDGEVAVVVKTDEGSTAANWLGLARAEGGRGIEAVGDDDRLMIVAYEAAVLGGAVSGEQFAVEETALDGEFGASAVAVITDDAAMSTFTRGAAVDDGADEAVTDDDFAVLGADDTDSVLI